MRFILAASIVSLAALTAAMPQPPIKAGVAIPLAKGSTLMNADALKLQLAMLQAKISRGFENFEKNTGAAHPSSTKWIEKRGNGIPLTDYSNNVWSGSIEVGTPLQTFTVQFDTGSSDLFLPGINCDSTCDWHTRWDPSTSSTSVDLDKTFSLSYGYNATVSGEQWSDTVSLAGFTATTQTLGAANTYSAGFQFPQFPPDGLMGMAYRSISHYPANPVFQSLVDQGQVSLPVFSFKLSSTPDSELFIGGSNPALFTGNFTYTPVTQQGFWQVNMDNIQGNGQVLQSNIDCIIDTGTSLIIGKPSDVSNIYNALGGTPAPNYGDGFYTFPCDSFPTVSLTFGGTTFDIFASALNRGPANSSDPSDCVSGLVGQDTDHPFWIVGDVFLQSVYTTFDMGNNQVGFATLA